MSQSVTWHPSCDCHHCETALVTAPHHCDIACTPHVPLGMWRRTMHIVHSSVWLCESLSAYWVSLPCRATSPHWLVDSSLLYPSIFIYLFHLYLYLYILSLSLSYLYIVCLHIYIYCIVIHSLLYTYIPLSFSLFAIAISSSWLLHWYRLLSFRSLF